MCKDSRWNFLGVTILQGVEFPIFLLIDSIWFSHGPYNSAARLRCLWSGSRNTMVKLDFKPEVEIWPFCACAMHPAIIIGTVRLLWTWLWGTHTQNACLVSFHFITVWLIAYVIRTRFLLSKIDECPLFWQLHPFYVCNFLYVIHDVMNFNEYVNDIDILVDNVHAARWKLVSQLKLILFSWVEFSWVESGVINKA